MGTPAVQQAPPPGWYPDPVEQQSRRHGQRYWNGTSWTPNVADRGQVSTDPMPPPVPDTRTALPGRAGWYALAGFLLGQVPAVADYLLGVQLAPDSLVLPLLVSQLGL